MGTFTHHTRKLVRELRGRIASDGGGCCDPQSSCCGGGPSVPLVHEELTPKPLLGSSGVTVPPSKPLPGETTMTRIQVFDPAMCCSTGICGPTVDPRLVRFSADLDWLKTQGVAIERHNLSQQPMAFVEDAEVKAALQTQGETALPLIKVNGKVQSLGTYPSRDQLAVWAGVDGPAKAILEIAERYLGARA